jgi:hypothetical protein
MKEYRQRSYSINLKGIETKEELEKMKLICELVTGLIVCTKK